MLSTTYCYQICTTHLITLLNKINHLLLSFGYQPLIVIIFGRNHLSTLLNNSNCLLLWYINIFKFFWGGYLGLWEFFFVFNCIFMIQFLKSFKGVHEVPPSSPLLTRMLLWRNVTLFSLSFNWSFTTYHYFTTIRATNNDTTFTTNK